MKLDFPHYNNVHGWLDTEALHFVSYFVESVLGDTEFKSLEIGVHEGKYFIGIENLTPPSAACLAIDVFDDQEKNIDNSGKGSLQKFTSNCEEYCVDPSRVNAIPMDSLDIEAAKLGRNEFGIISVDGGHTQRHTVSDLKVAAELMAPNALVILDDILNPNWTGVVSGACEFFGNSRSGRLVPFAIGYNKLFCCHFSLQSKLIKQLFQDRETLKTAGINPFKMTEFAGHDIVTLHSIK